MGDPSRSTTVLQSLRPAIPRRNIRTPHPKSFQGSLRESTHTTYFWIQRCNSRGEAALIRGHSSRYLGYSGLVSKPGEDVHIITMATKGPAYIAVLRLVTDPVAEQQKFAARVITGNLFCWILLPHLLAAFHCYDNDHIGIPTLLAFNAGAATVLAIIAK